MTNVQMKSQVEWILVGGLVLLLATGVSIPGLKAALSSPIGKGLALLAIVYVWTSQSKLVALLLLAVYLRCPCHQTREHLANKGCSKEGYTLAADGKCKDKDGKVDEGGLQLCVGGQAWNSTTRKCEGVTTGFAEVPETVLTSPTGTVIGDDEEKTPEPPPQIVPVPLEKKEGFVPNETARSNYAPL
jgi:hypothetical protein